MPSSYFCKFCYDCGRGDFDTHLTRNRQGKLTCKYLASISCSKCGEKGHTINYCRSNIVFKPINKSNHWFGATSGIKKLSQSRQESNSAIVSNLLGGAFSALLIDDDDDDDLQKGDDDDHELQKGEDGNNDLQKGEDGNNHDMVTITWATTSKSFDLFSEFKNREKRSWADMVDDDDE